MVDDRSLRTHRRLQVGDELLRLARYFHLFNWFLVLFFLYLCLLKAEEGLMEVISWSEVHDLICTIKLAEQSRFRLCVVFSRDRQFSCYLLEPLALLFCLGAGKRKPVATANRLLILWAVRKLAMIHDYRGSFGMKAGTRRQERHERE